MRFIIGIIFGVLVVIFVVQNTEVAEISFLIWSFTVSRAVMYLIIFVLGLSMGWISRSFKRKKKK